MSFLHASLFEEMIATPPPLDDARALWKTWWVGGVQCRRAGLPCKTFVSVRPSMSRDFIVIILYVPADLDEERTEFALRRPIRRELEVMPVPECSFRDVVGCCKTSL